ncbi:MAG TPA: hypothetical protein VFG81_14355 [Anaerolineales bacterium]|jgi:hypothetical protein|nr:hypothetical protein [Anaerolineales bacterium]
MFKNRFILILAALSMSLVTLAVSQSFSKPPKTVDLSQSSQPVAALVTGPKADQLYVMDSATRSYIARGQAIQVRNAMDSGTRSYIAWGQALEKAKLNGLDSGTRSYIAWGEALEAAGKLGNSAACTTTSQENIFARIDSSLDSATRSYIAWGLALQAKDDIQVLCR